MSVNFKDIMVPASEWGHQKPAKIHIPKDSPMPSGKFPLIIAFGGIYVQTANMLNEGLPMVVEKYGTQYGGTNESGLAKVGFAVLAIGADPGGYAADHKWMQWAIPWLIQNYPIDQNCIAPTGLSAGGLECILCVTDPLTAKFFSSAIPMSIAGPGIDYKQLLINQIYTWFFCGDSEGNYTTFTRDAFAAANKSFPGSSFKDEFQGQGHCCWDVQSKDSYEGKALKGSSVYDFALFYRKGKGDITNPDPLPPNGQLPLPGNDESLVASVLTNAGWIGVYSEGGVKMLGNFDPALY